MKRIHERCRVAIQKHYWQWVSARLLVSWETLTHHIQNHFWLILWTNSPLILLWVFAGDNRKRLLYVLTYLVFWGILYLLAFMVKLEARVFTPLLLLLFLSMVFHWVSDKGLVKSNEYLLYVLVGLSPFVFCYEGFQVWQNRQYVEENKKLLSRITGQHKYSIINYDANCTDLFAVYPFTRPELFGKESTVVDAGHLTYCGGTEEHIERILGEKPRSMKHYYEMLSNKKDEVILLGDPIRTEFILSYLRVVWNCVLTLKPVDVLSTESYQTYEIVEMHDIN